MHVQNVLTNSSKEQCALLFFHCFGVISQLNIYSSQLLQQTLILNNNLSIMFCTSCQMRCFHPGYQWLSESVWVFSQCFEWHANNVNNMPRFLKWQDTSHISAFKLYSAFSPVAITTHLCWAPSMTEERYFVVFLVLLASPSLCLLLDVFCQPSVALDGAPTSGCEPSRIEIL